MVRCMHTVVYLYGIRDLHNKYGVVLFVVCGFVVFDSACASVSVCVCVCVRDGVVLFVVGGFVVFDTACASVSVCVCV